MNVHRVLCHQTCAKPNRKTLHPLVVWNGKPFIKLNPQSYRCRSCFTLLHEVAPRALVPFQWAFLAMWTGSEDLNRRCFFSLLRCLDFLCFHTKKQITSTSHRMESPTISFFGDDHQTTWTKELYESGRYDCLPHAMMQADARALFDGRSVRKRSRRTTSKGDSC